MEPNEASPNEPRRFSERKEVKLHLPLKTHVQLHAAKLLTNQSIQESVVSALAAYFSHHPVEPMA